MRVIRRWPLMCMVSACIVWILLGFFVDKIGGPDVSYDDNGVGTVVFMGDMVAFNIMSPGFAISRQLHLRVGGLAGVIVASFVCLALAWILDKGLHEVKSKWIDVTNRRNRT